MYSRETPPPVEAALVDAEDAHARQIILEYAKLNEPFARYGLTFLKKVMATSVEGPVTDSQLAQLDTSDLPHLLDRLQELQEAAEPKRLSSRSAINRIGLFLCGKKDAEIWEVYPSTKGPSQFSDERSKFRRSLDTERRPARIKDALYEKRAQAIGQLIAEKVLYGRDKIQTGELTRAEMGLTPQKIYIYDARDTLAALEERMQEKKIIGPGSEGLLIRHFMDGSHTSGSTADQLAIRHALHEMRRRLQARLQQEPVAPVRTELYDSLKFLSLMLGNKTNMPESRASYVRTLLARHPEVPVESVMRHDNRRLNVALSWLYAQPVPRESTNEEEAS